MTLKLDEGRYSLKYNLKDTNFLQVMKPLDVKTKFYNAERDEVYLEAQVQNITQGIITLERVSLEPSNVFTGNHVFFKYFRWIGRGILRGNAKVIIFG